MSNQSKPQAQESITTDRTEQNRPKDPSEFIEEKDGVTYHLCDLPQHVHSIPVTFKTCYEPGARTWESKYSWMSIKNKEVHVTTREQAIEEGIPESPEES